MTDNIAWLEKITGLQYPPEIRELLITLTEMEDAPSVKFYYGPFGDSFTVMDFKKLNDIRYKTYFHLNSEERYHNPYAVVSMVTESFEDTRVDANAGSFQCLPFAYDHPGCRYLGFTGKEAELAAVHMERPEFLLFNTGQMPLFNTSDVLEQVRVKKPVWLQHPKITQFVSRDLWITHYLYHEGGDRWYHELMNELAKVAHNEMRLDHFEGNIDSDKLRCVLEVNGQRVEFLLKESDELDVSIIYYLNELLKKTSVKKRFCVCGIDSFYEELIFAFVDEQEYEALKTNFFLTQTHLWDR